MRVYGPEVRERCRQAENALEWVTARTGFYARGSELLRAWTAANEGSSPPPQVKLGGWLRVFEPAIAAGRIRCEARGRTWFFAPTSRPELTLPPPRKEPRKFSVALLELCDQALESLNRAVATKSAWVSAEDLEEAWRSVHDAPIPLRCASPWPRALLPAITDGRVLVQRSGRHVYYAPAEHADLPVPAFGSDMERVAEALRRATGRLQSAVLVEEVEREIAAAQELALKSSVETSIFLSSLVRWKRATILRPFPRSSAGRNYYSLPEGPRWVRREAEHPMDRRIRAIRSFWRASGGRPFTTRSLRLFSESREGLRFSNDPTYGWTNAMQHLEGLGEVVRVGIYFNRYVRWAPAAEWEALDNATRATRMRTPFGELVAEDWKRGANSRAAPYTDGCEAPQGADADASPYDVTFVSRNHDMRILIQLAKEIAADQELATNQPEIVLARPVSVRQILEAARHHPRWASTSKEEITATLHEAARIRPLVRRSAVTLIGVVGNRGFYDLASTPTVVAYVAYRQSLQAAGLIRFQRALRQLQSVIAWSENERFPLAAPIREARRLSLKTELQAAIDSLRLTAGMASLLDEERQHVRAVLGELEELAGDRALTQAVVLPAPAEGVSVAIGEPFRIDPAEAWSHIEGLDGITLQVPKALPSRLPSVRVIKAVAPNRKRRLLAPERARPGRRAHTSLDRAAFACYAIARWAGPNLATFAARAFHVLGELRDPTPFIAVLKSNKYLASHVMAASALGILDDSLSRNALVNYLNKGLTPSGDYRRGIPPSGVRAAVYGLARLPFGGLATSLRPKERDMLERVALNAADPELQKVARRVLTAWTEKWRRNQLLYL